MVGRMAEYSQTRGNALMRGTWLVYWGGLRSWERKTQRGGGKALMTCLAEPVLGKGGFSGPGLGIHAADKSASAQIPRHPKIPQSSKIALGTWKHPFHFPPFSGIRSFLCLPDNPTTRHNLGGDALPAILVYFLVSLPLHIPIRQLGW